MEEEQFSTATAVADGFLEAYKVVLKQNDGYKKPWTLTRKAAVYINVDTLFGIKFTEYMDTGGPQPVNLLHYLNFNPSAGSLWEIEQLFGAQKVNKWKQQAEEIFRKQQQISPEESFDAVGYWFPGGKFSLPDNYRLTPDSVIFYFNPKEVAPHVTELVEIAIKRK